MLTLLMNYLLTGDLRPQRGGGPHPGLAGQPRGHGHDLRALRGARLRGALGRGQDAREGPRGGAREGVRQQGGRTG